jgi:hypothetical protein
VSRICCPLVSYSHFIHSFTCLLVPILPYFHSPCIFPIRPSHSILLSFAYLGAYCLQIACIIRLGDSERHATPRPRFAALRHPIFLVSTLPTTWPSIAPGRPLTGTHTHTYCIHPFTHTFIHILLLRPPPQLWRGTQTNRYPAARRIRLRAQHPTSP